MKLRNSPFTFLKHLSITLYCQISIISYSFLPFVLRFGFYLWPQCCLTIEILIICIRASEKLSRVAESNCSNGRQNSSRLQGYQFRKQNHPTPALRVTLFTARREFKTQPRVFAIVRNHLVTTRNMKISCFCVQICQDRLEEKLLRRKHMWRSNKIRLIPGIKIINSN